MEVIQQRLADAFATIGENFVSGLADFIVVLLFLAIGWIVAKFLCYFLNKFLESIGLEKWIKKKGMDTKELRINNLYITNRCGKLFAWDRRNL